MSRIGLMMLTTVAVTCYADASVGTAVSIPGMPVYTNSQHSGMPRVRGGVADKTRDLAVMMLVLLIVVVV